MGFAHILAMRLHSLVNIIDSTTLSRARESVDLWKTAVRNIFSFSNKNIGYVNSRPENKYQRGITDKTFSKISIKRPLRN